MKRIWLSAFLALLFIATFVLGQSASNWRLATESDKSRIYYKNLTRVKGIARVWIKYTHKDQRDNPVEIVSYEEYDCAGGRTRATSGVEYFKDGSVNQLPDAARPAWSRIIPDSIGEEMQGIFCNGQQDLEAKRAAQKKPLNIDYDALIPKKPSIDFSDVARPAQSDLPDLVEQVKPAIVKIQVFNGGKLIGSGTAFFISSDTLVTNAHVIKDANQVSFEGVAGHIKSDCSVLAEDSNVDLALLKLDTAVSNIQPLKAADTPPRIGEKIFVVGNPRGLGWTLSEGIVSAYRNFERGGERLQHTADISPGSSGSPVFNMRGEVVAVVEGALEDSQRLNFAIPTKYVRALVGVARSNPAPRQPSLSRAYTIQVRLTPSSLRNGWLNTGLVVPIGASLRIRASGVLALDGRHDAEPQGSYALADKDKLMQDEATGALIAVIGDDNNDFLFIGKERTLTTQRQGVLFLGVNEGRLDDDSGFYDIELTLNPQ